MLSTAFLEVHDARHGSCERLRVMKLSADISLHLENFDPAVEAKERFSSVLSSALQGTVCGSEAGCFAWP